MDVREILAELEADGALVTVEKPVDRELEMARIIRALGDRAVRFTNVRDSDVPVVANLCARREYMARALGAPVGRLLHVLAEALAHPAEPPIVGRASCQQVIEPTVDLRGDLKGPYLARHPAPRGSPKGHGGSRPVRVGVDRGQDQRRFGHFEGLASIVDEAERLLERPAGLQTEPADVGIDAHVR